MVNYCDLCWHPPVFMGQNTLNWPNWGYFHAEMMSFQIVQYCPTQTQDASKLACAYEMNRLSNLKRLAIKIERVFVRVDQSCWC